MGSFVAETRDKSHVVGLAFEQIGGGKEPVFFSLV